MSFTIAQTAAGSVIDMLPALANRHGLIAGATGTGKTITLQRLAEEFSALGVPVFMADVKGDLSGLSRAGELSPKLAKRLAELKMPEPAFAANPVIFWDVFGQLGHPLKTTLSEMGPLLLSRLMDLNETQSSVLQILFKIADDSGLLLIDLKDITGLINLVQENLAKFKPQYGHLSAASLGTIQRGLLTLEERGAGYFFGEPALDIHDFLQIDSQGRGYINILASDKLLQSPVVYSTMLLWLLSELFEVLPEVGDLDKPKIAFFFDEAHLLFNDAPKALMEKIELVVRLIRSKGVGVYFATQNPLDIPESVLGQLQHRFQHALKAFTPADQKAVKIAAQTLRPNPLFNTEEAITQMGVGEALVSVLEPKGAPTIVERAFIFPPRSRIGTVSAEERAETLKASPLAGHYEQKIDRESAFEQIAKQRASVQAGQEQEPEPEPEKAEQQAEGKNVLNDILFGTTGPRGGRKAGLVEKAATSAVRSIATSVGRELVRGILGSLTGGKRR